MKLSKYVVYFLTVTLSVVLLNLLWVKINFIPPFYDTAGHTNLAFIHSHVFSGTFERSNLVHFLKISTYYPPLLFMIGGFISNIFSMDYKVLQYFSVLVLGIVNLLLFLSVKELTGKKSIAFLTSFFFIFFPHVWEQSRYFMLDLPLTAFLLASVYFLIKSNFFRNKTYSILFFVFISFAQLTKWYAWVYLLIPVAFYLVQAVSAHPSKKALCKSLLPYLFIPATLVLPWYLINLKEILYSFKLFSQPDYADPVNLISFKNILYYPLMVFNYEVVSLQFIWLLAASYLFLKSKYKWILLHILFVYSVFTFLGNKNLRYVMPILPYFAFIMAYGLVKLKLKYVKAYIGILLMFTIFNPLLFLVNSFGFPFKADTTLVWQIPNIGPAILLNLSSKDIVYIAQQSSWDPKVIIKDITSLSKEDETILVVRNDPFISVAGLEVFSLPKNYNLRFRDAPLDLEKDLKNENIDLYLQQFSYIIVPEKNVGHISQSNYKNLETLRQFILGGRTREYALLKKYNLPDGDTAYLLKRDLTYNKLNFSLHDEVLNIERKPALSRIYLQFMDFEDKWHEEIIESNQTSYTKNVKGIQILRVDYPPDLLNATWNEKWHYDQDVQFDLVIR